MTELPPDWAFKIYSKLWLKFNTKEFSNYEAKKLVRNYILNQAISRLKRDGWLKIGLDTEDARKSVYSLKDPKEAIEEIIKEKSENEKRI